MVEKLLALPLGDDEDFVIYSKFTLHCEYFKKVEPAGEAFEALLSKKLNPNAHFFDDVENENIDEMVDEIYEWEKEYRNTKGKDIMGFKMKKDNFYSLLGLENESINATPDDVRKAYKKQALLYHPDKIETESQEEMEEANKNWLRFKEAYETLTDPERKAKYDSTIDFDDKIPSQKEISKIKEDYDFFRIFGPAFIKNSIWSVNKPVPKIGDMNTDIKKVKRFYNFWYSFKSWRDFSVEGEHNLDDAEGRYEKRQMLKENKKLKSEMILKEKARITNLVSLAYENDPRIKLEEKKVEDEKKLRAEQVQKKKKEAEEESKRLMIEYEENKKKELVEKERRKNELYNNLFKTIKELEINITNDDEFHIQINANYDSLCLITDEINKKTTKEEKIKAFFEIGSKYFGVKIVSKQVENNVWDKNQLFNLQKAIKKYPGGTGNRWEKIKEIVKTKSIDEIIAMTHYLAINPSVKFNGEEINLDDLLNKKTKTDNKIDNKEIKVENNEKVKDETNNKDDWSELQQKALEAAIKKYPGSIPANERWTKIAEEVPDKNKKQCVERFKFLAEKIKKSST